MNHHCPQGSPTAITGWQSACFGDIEQDWAPFVFAPSLHLFFHGYGLDDVKARLQDPASLGRLKAHVAMALLRHLMRLVEIPLSSKQAMGVEQFQAMVEKLRTPNWLEEHVQQALRGEDRSPHSPINPIRAATRWTLEAFAIDPNTAQLPLLLGALGALELAEKHETHAEGALSVARKACLLLPNQGIPHPFEEVIDIPSKIKEWAQLVFAAFTRSERLWSQTVTSIWLISKALERLDFKVEPHIVYAIDGFLRGLTHEQEKEIQSMRSPEKNLTQQQNVLHGVLGLAALK